MSQSERSAIAEKACAELRAADFQALQRLRIVNTARESIGGEVFLGEDKEIRRYLRWETCEQFILQDEGYLSETNRREKAYSLIKRNTESEGGRVFSEYFDGDAYLVSAGSDTTAVLIDTSNMSAYSGIFIGYKREADEDGNITYYTSERNYVSGELDGLNRDWHLNGQIAREINLVDGMSHGLWREWHSNGQVKSECQSDTGKCFYRKWYENGQLEQEGYLENDKRNGIWKRWRENGDFVEQATFVDNVRQ
jgi:hypothetical protein